MYVCMYVHVYKMDFSLCVSLKKFESHCFRGKEE